MSELPLAGIRVLDLTMSWAGPWCTKILGDLGAEVIKVEAVQSPDLTRGPVAREDWRAYARRGDPRPYERADTFLKANRNKLGITLNLKDPAGVGLFEDLVRVSDIVAENYAPGEMERFGLGFHRLRTLNARTILLRMPAMGWTGPERSYVGFGSTMEMLAGITELTGYENGPPVKSGFWYGDPIAGVHAAGAVMMALLEREATGQGSIVEVAQIETLTGFTFDAIAYYGMTGDTYPRMGNRDLAFAPQGCYRVQGADEWIVISVCEDEQWPVLARLIGRDDLADADDLREAPGRHIRHAELDAAIVAWAENRTRDDAITALRAAGVVAAPVNRNRHLFEDPHVQERDFLEEVAHPLAGSHRYPASAFLLDGRRLRTYRPAPIFGEHNDVVLGGILGLTDGELAQLERDHVIGWRPLEDRWAG